MHRTKRIFVLYARPLLLAAVCVYTITITHISTLVTARTPTQHPQTYTTPEGKPYQYVVFAFDGSRGLDEWRETLDFAKKMSTPERPFHFTYFINAIYLLPYAERMQYHPPHGPLGGSQIGYGLDDNEVGQRIAYINEAYAAGHEIGSHGVGHFPAKGWTVDDWKSEFTQFNQILNDVRAGKHTTVPLTVPASAIRGFRAPYLIAGKNLDEALDAFDFTYDASYPREMGTAPYTLGAHTEFPLAIIPYVGREQIIAMDYNFYMHDSGAKNILKKDTPAWHKEHDAMLAAYKGYFLHEYMGTRAPVLIGHHFSTWNDDLYWDVLKEAAEYMCTQPYVRCATYSEALQSIESIKNAEPSHVMARQRII